MIKRKIFIACDTTNPKKVQNIINQSKSNKIQIGSLKTIGEAKIGTPPANMCAIFLL